MSLTCSVESHLTNPGLISKFYLAGIIIRMVGLAAVVNPLVSKVGLRGRHAVTGHE